MTANSITTETYDKADINATSEDGVIQLSVEKKQMYEPVGLYTIAYEVTASLQGIYYCYSVLFRNKAVTHTLRY